MTFLTARRFYSVFASAAGAIALSACVAAVPLPGEQRGDVSSASYATTNNDPTRCSGAEPVTNDLSSGTQKVIVVDSCDMVEVTITNEHQEHPKKCTVVIGDKGVELYIRVGEERVVSQGKPLGANRVVYTCRNDWNRPR